MATRATPPPRKWFATSSAWAISLRNVHLRVRPIPISGDGTGDLLHCRRGPFTRVPLVPTDDQTVKPAEDVDEVVDESLEDDEGLFHMQESALTYFGADFDVRGLVHRLDDGDIVIPRFDPDESDGASLDGFQRRPVWNKTRMEKFIESLLLGWPVPSIFMVLDSDQRYLVLDGQQRLTAIQRFYDGYYPDGKEFTLTNVAEHLRGSTYKTLGPDSKRRLNNTFIQATVIEPNGVDGPESVYRLFDRLNSGGVSLTAQEIRVALFLGPAINWIRDLNTNQDWRELYGPPSQRLKDHELILRSLAMEEVVSRVRGRWDDDSVRISAYRPPMSDCLNSFLTRNRSLAELDVESFTQAFNGSCEVLFQAANRDALRLNNRINAAHVDAVLSSLMWLHLNDEIPDAASVESSLVALRTNDKYIEYVTRSTSHRESVLGRLRLALNTLGGGQRL